MSHEIPPERQSIRYVKLRNERSFPVHLLVMDATGRQKVWGNGVSVKRKTDAVFDLSNIAGIQNGSSYRFGVSRLIGSNVISDQEYMVDFASNAVGLFTYKNTRGSKVTLDGYEGLE